MKAKAGAGEGNARWMWPALLAALLVAVLASGGPSGPPAAQAAGEGSFSLNKPSYTVVEGEAVPVIINRAGGEKLASDVVVTVRISGGEVDTDYPAATETQQLTFPAGSNLGSQQLYFQTLNQNRYEIDKAIYITILSVSNGGSIGNISTAPVTMLGRQQPRVTDVTPKSAVPGQKLVITGANFMSGALQVNLVEFFYPGTAATAPTPTILGVISPTEIWVEVPPAYAGVVPDGAQFTVRVTMPLSPIEFALSPDVPEARFFYNDGPTVTALSTRTGPVTGGTTVRLYGSNLTAPPNFCTGGQVRVGNETVPPQDCQMLPDGTIEIVTPAGDAPGPTNIVVGNSPITSENVFTYTGGPEVIAMSPMAGPAYGGQPVQVKGSGFPVGLTCDSPLLDVTFSGHHAASCQVVDANTMMVVTPLDLGPGTGVRQLTVHVNGVASAYTEAADFIFVDNAPVVSSIAPAGGAPQGGTVVEVSGAGFAPGATVLFGSVPAGFVTFKNATLIEAVSPPGSGTVDVSVTVDGLTSPNTPGDNFAYSGPTITALAPHAGPLAAGTVVLVTGTNFTQGAKVAFGPTQVDATYISPTQVAAAAPAALAPGPVAVTVITPSGGSAPATYTYTNGPIVASMDPAAGPTSGGTIVILKGTKFLAGAKVFFGDKEAPSNVNSETQITAVSPSVAAGGPVDVTVVTSGGTSPPGSGAVFTYTSGPPSVVQLTPASGTTKGGTIVTITGTGFLGVACPGGVNFGTIPATSCTVNNDTSITAVSPPNVEGKTFVTVTSPGGTSEIALNYEYVFQPAGPGPGPGNPGGGPTAPPPTGNIVVYSLGMRWSLVTWLGGDNMTVAGALLGAGPQAANITPRVSALYTWDPASSTWLSYFPSASGIPGVSTFTQLRRGQVYWVAVTEPVSWSVLDQE